MNGWVTGGGEGGGAANITLRASLNVNGLLTAGCRRDVHDVVGPLSGPTFRRKAFTKTPAHSTDDGAGTRQTAHGRAQVQSHLEKGNSVAIAQSAVGELALLGSAYSLTIQAYGFLLSCMDRRMKPDTFLQRDFGEMFVVRNAGNNFPHAKHTRESTTGIIHEDNYNVLSVG